jgi:hypothetical protein
MTNDEGSPNLESMESQPDEPFNPYASPKSEVGTGSSEGIEALAEGEVIRGQGTVSPRDLFLANKLTSRPGPGDLLGCLVLLVFVLAPWGVLLSLSAGWLGGAVTALFGLGIAVFVGVKALMKTREIDGYWRRQRGVFQAQRIEISDAEIRLQSEAGWSVYRWSAFSKHTASVRVMVLHFDPPTAFLYEPPHAFLVIPRAFFAHQTDWDRFVRLVHEKLPQEYHQGRAR